MDHGVFQKINLTKRIYTCESSGYRVVATEAPNAHSAGVAVFYRTKKHFSKEALQTYGANVVRFQMASGNRCWYIVGFYLTPENTSTKEDVVAAISKRPRGAALLVVGNFNTNLAAPEGWERNEGIAAALAEEVLEDMSSYFLSRHNLWLKDGLTWAMHQYYILDTDSCLF